jgi:glutathione peroxidase
MLQKTVPLLFFLFMMGCFGAGKRISKPEGIVSTENVVMNAQKTLHDFTMTAIDGSSIDLAAYKGKKVMLVNVASRCGYTPQYADLQKLHDRHGDKIAILGFPANNFGSQEPGSNEDIASFCQKNYGVTFQMFEKISVKGNDQHPLYGWLSDKSLNGWNEQSPSWNFCKYIVDENGQLIKFYGSGVNPMDPEILALLE